MRPVDAGTANYREIYWRVYVRYQPGWVGGGADKLSRAQVFASSNWAQAMAAHVWSGSNSSTYNYLALDPASGTDNAGNLLTTTYNDFAHWRWLGAAQSATPIFDAQHVGQWYCVESHVRLNTAGNSDGVFEVWINGSLEARSTGLNWVGSYSAYGINSVFLENYWNAGAPVAEDRYLDNFVVSTQPIGCVGSAPPPPPTQVVTTVSVAPANASLTSVGSTAQLTAAAYDASNVQMTGQSFTWASSNTAVATVSSAGLVTSRGAGSATITATAAGIQGSATVSVAISQTVARVTVTPGSTSLTSVGSTAQLAAAAYDASNVQMTGQTFTWASSNTAVATVSAAGQVTARAAGSATITATDAGIQGSATVSVAISQTVARVAVTPGSTSLTSVGAAAQLTAAAYDASNVQMTGRTFTWASSNTAVATVSASGLVTAVATGTATITATDGGVQGSATVNVSISVPSGGQNPAGTGLLIGPLTVASGIVPAPSATPYFTDYGQFTAIADATSPTGHSLRGTYNSGSEYDRCLYADLGSSHSKLYARMLYKVDSNWPTGGTKKVLQFRQGFNQLYSILDIEGGKWHLFNALTGNWIGSNAHAAYDPGNLKNQWVDLGYLIEAVDGSHMRHRIWVNGSLEIDVTVSGSTFAPSVVMFGGVFNSPAGNDTDWLVNNAVYTGAQGY
jgi:uncharacterized protein YjdB